MLENAKKGETKKAEGILAFSLPKNHNGNNKRRTLKKNRNPRPHGEGPSCGKFANNVLIYSVYNILIYSIRIENKRRLFSKNKRQFCPPFYGSYDTCAQITGRSPLYWKQDSYPNSRA